MRLETYQHLVDILETSNTPMSTQEIATKIQLSRSVTSFTNSATFAQYS